MKYGFNTMFINFDNIFITFFIICIIYVLVQYLNGDLNNTTINILYGIILFILAKTVFHYLGKFPKLNINVDELYDKKNNNDYKDYILTHTPTYTNNIALDMIEMGETINPVESNKIPVVKQSSENVSPYSEKIINYKKNNLDTYMPQALV